MGKFHRGESKIRKVKKRSHGKKKAKKQVKKLEKAKTNVIEVAKKKRHLYLLDKLQKNKPLTNAELKELQKFEGGDLRGGLVVSQEQVAEAFDTSLRTVSRWVSEGMPRTAEGFYDLLAIQDWRIGKDQNNDDKQKELRIELLELKIQNLQLDIKEREGHLIPREVALKALTDNILSIKQQFLAIPEQVTPQIMGLEPFDASKVKEILSLRLREIISEFAEGKHL